MARTLRRKNYIQTKNTTWGRQGCKINGYYTEYDFDDYGLQLFRPCTEEERFRLYKEAHLDAGTTNYHSFDTWARKMEMKRDRQRVRLEIHRFMIGVVEDVIVSNQAKFPYWYW